MKGVRRLSHQSVTDRLKPLGTQTQVTTENLRQCIPYRSFRELKALDNSKRFIPGEWPLPSFSPLSRCQGRCADKFHPERPTLARRAVGRSAGLSAERR